MVVSTLTQNLTFCPPPPPAPLPTPGTIVAPAIQTAPTTQSSVGSSSTPQTTQTIPTPSFRSNATSTACVEGQRYWAGTLVCLSGQFVLQQPYSLQTATTLSASLRLEAPLTVGAGVALVIDGQLEVIQSQSFTTSVNSTVIATGAFVTFGSSVVQLALVNNQSVIGFQIYQCAEIHGSLIIDSTDLVSLEPPVTVFLTYGCLNANSKFDLLSTTDNNGRDPCISVAYDSSRARITLDELSCRTTPLVSASPRPVASGSIIALLIIISVNLFLWFV